MQIHQTLHAYVSGMGLQATSFTNTGLLHPLNAISDLSGFLPVGVQFDSYVTGYATDDLYVFARSWSDPDCGRSGCVITHSLSVIRGPTILGRIGDLWSLAALHSRWDRTAAGLERYRSVIEIDESLPAPPIEEIDEETWMRIRIKFTHSERRPICLQADEQTGAAISRRIWRELPPYLRAGFSFCSFALGPRHKPISFHAPFDFLCLPRASMGAFLQQHRDLVTTPPVRTNAAR